MMRTLVNYDPASEFRAMDEWFDRMFGALTPTVQNRNVMVMPVDILEQNGKLQIKASVPGVDPKDLEVSVENNVLTIRGETKQDTVTNEARVYRREIMTGRTSRSIRLPDGLDLGQVDAEFRNGNVTITIPRLPEQKPEARRINIRTADGQSQAIEANAQSEQANESKKR